MTMANTARKIKIPEPCLLCGGEKRPDEIVCAECFDRGLEEQAEAEQVDPPGPSGFWGQVAKDNPR